MALLGSRNYISSGSGNDVEMGEIIGQVVEFFPDRFAIGQLFLRPTASLYRTPSPNLFLCSASTPPGAGVHGMCGYHAAARALRVR